MPWCGEENGLKGSRGYYLEQSNNPTFFENRQGNIVVNGKTVSEQMPTSLSSFGHRIFISSVNGPILFIHINVYNTCALGISRRA